MFCVYTEIMAQDNKLLLNKTTPHFQLLPMSKVKDIENLAIILVPLIMTLSRGHTGQIKRTVIMR